MPHANPSTLSAAQNTAVRDAIDGGGMRFVGLAGITGDDERMRTTVAEGDEDEDGDIWDVVSEDGGVRRLDEASVSPEARKRPRLDGVAASHG